MSEAPVPEQNRARGWILRVASWLMRLVGALAAGTAIQAPRAGQLTSNPEPQYAIILILLGIAGTALFAASLTVGRRARQHLARVVRSPDELAPGSYVLYLRPFTQDPGGSGIAPAAGPDPLDSFTVRSGRTYEERLARMFRGFGPTVAVGRPGEQLPAGPGAWRIYLPPDGWQDTVRKLIDQARLIVLGAGPGPGTVWEYVEILLRGDPFRLVVLVTSPDDYQRFIQASLAAVHGALPELRQRYGDGWAPPVLPGLPRPRRPRLKLSFYLLAMIYFRGDWSPNLIYFDRSSSSSGSFPWEVSRYYRRMMRPMIACFKVQPARRGAPGVPR